MHMLGLMVIGGVSWWLPRWLPGGAGVWLARSGWLMIGASLAKMLAVLVAGATFF